MLLTDHSKFAKMRLPSKTSTRKSDRLGDRSALHIKCKDKSMKSHLPILSTLALAALSQGCTSQNAKPEEMVAAVQQVDAQFQQAFSKGDVDGVMALYWNSPDLVVFPPDQLQARGYDQVRQGITDAMKQMPGGKLQLTEAHYIPQGDAVIGWGLWTMSFPDSHGATPDMRGRYTELAMKKDGKWVIVLDHPSVPLPPPPNAAK
jgi:uncharacterized protein (TIGR02246 family)